MISFRLGTSLSSELLILMLIINYACAVPKERKRNPKFPYVTQLTIYSSLQGQTFKSFYRFGREKSCFKVKKDVSEENAF